MRTTKPITVSLPADLLQEAQRAAKEDARTRSELIREALRQYLATRRWQRLRQWGAETAERLGLKSEADLERLVARARFAFTRIGLRPVPENTSPISPPRRDDWEATEPTRGT